MATKQQWAKCGYCAGDGEIECPCCNGTGEIRKELSSECIPGDHKPLRPQRLGSFDVVVPLECHCGKSHLYKVVYNGRTFEVLERIS